MLNMHRRLARSKVGPHNPRTKKSRLALAVGATAAAVLAGALWLTTRTPSSIKRETVSTPLIVQPREPAHKLLPTRVPAAKEITLPPRTKKDLSNPHILTRKQLRRYIEDARRTLKFDSTYEIAGAKQTFDIITARFFFKKYVQKLFDPTAYNFAKPDWKYPKNPSRLPSKSPLGRLLQKGASGIHYLARMQAEYEALWNSPIGTLVKFRHEGKNEPIEFFCVKIHSDRKGEDKYITGFPHPPSTYSGFTRVYSERTFYMQQLNVREIDHFTYKTVTVDGIKKFTRDGHYIGEHGGLTQLLFYDLLRVDEVYRPKH